MTPTGTTISRNPPPGSKRVHTPTFIESFRITITDVRHRLGRTAVTLLGIVLGIAFLMSTLLTANIRLSLHDVTQRRNAVQNMVATLRAEIGNPDGKKILILTAGPDPGKLLDDFTNQLRELGVVVAAARGDANAAAGAFALIVWAGEDGTSVHADWSAYLAALKQPVVLFYGDRPTIEERIAETARIRDLMPPVTERQQESLRAERARSRTRTRWLVGVSLLVATIGISNALLMSVTERYREIGTMKCLGALNSFIMRLILMESSMLGLMGAAAGIGLGTLFAIFAYSSTYGFDVVVDALEGRVILVAGGVCLVLGWTVSVVAAIYPANVAARMVPADALRTEI